MSISIDTKKSTHPHDNNPKESRNRKALPWHNNEWPIANIIRNVWNLKAFPLKSGKRYAHCLQFYQTYMEY